MAHTEPWEEEGEGEGEGEGAIEHNKGKKKGRRIIKHLHK